MDPRHDVDEAVAELRSETFALIERLRRGPTSAQSDMSRVLVELQGVANQLGGIEAMLARRLRDAA